MNYPTEFDKLVQDIEAKRFLKQRGGKRCIAAENGGCFCTGWCKGDVENNESYTDDVQIDLSKLT